MHPFPQSHSPATAEDHVVSVLIPAYNHASYIASTLDSVARSTHRRLELVLVDDASGDSTFNVVQEWIERHGARFERVVLERHPRNRGISATLNELVGAAQGEFLTFVASDDTLVPSGIARQVAYAVERNVGFVFADSELIDESGGLISDSAIRFHGRRLASLQRRRCLVTDVLLNWEAPWTRIFIRRDLLLHLGMFDERLQFEDRDFIIRILIHGSFGLLGEPVYRYRMRRTNRLTPGLDASRMREDFQRSEAKNFRAATGLVRLLLGLNVMAGKMRFDRLGKPRRSRVWPLFAALRRMVVWVHLWSMRGSGEPQARRGRVSA